MKNLPVITIDGPAGSGKGTIAQRVAKQLDYKILDSGSLYRLVALVVQQKNLDVNSADVIGDITEIAKKLDVTFEPCVNGGIEIVLNGANVTQAIRHEDCGNMASKVAAIQSVRAALLERQRQFLEAPGLVADGRDMGTVVFPNAPVKVFLTASAQIRGERRLNQLKQQGIDANLRGLIRDIEERDARDTNRKDAPLIPADDAIIIDTGKYSIDEVVEMVMVKVQNVI